VTEERDWRRRGRRGSRGGPRGARGIRRPADGSFPLGLAQEVGRPVRPPGRSRASSCSLRTPSAPRARDRPCFGRSAMPASRFPASPAGPGGDDLRCWRQRSARLSPGLSRPVCLGVRPAVGTAPRHLRRGSPGWEQRRVGSGGHRCGEPNGAQQTERRGAVRASRFRRASSSPWRTRRVASARRRPTINLGPRWPRRGQGPAGRLRPQGSVGGLGLNPNSMDLTVYDC